MSLACGGFQCYPLSEFIMCSHDIRVPRAPWPSGSNHALSSDFLVEIATALIMLILVALNQVIRDQYRLYRFCNVIVGELI